MKTKITLLCLLLTSSLTYGQWQNNGSVLSTTDNVGIGTSSPVNGNLHIYRNATIGGWGTGPDNLKITDSGLRIQDSGSSMYFDGNAIISNGNFLIGTNASKKLTLGTNSSERITILENGNVGIDMDNPQGLLHVGRDEESELRIGTNPQLVFKKQTDHFYMAVTGSDHANYPLRIGRSDGIGTIYFDQETHFTQNIGVGVSSPQSLLHIGNGTESELRLGSNPQLTISKETDRFRLQVHGSNHESNPLHIGRSDGVGMVNFTGKVGIGMQDTTPTHKLEVNGTIRSKEIKVEASPWPDYVFAEDYELSSLEETAKFIEANHHLPEIPSASEIEANGVELGKMNMLLLKKIEELTLHLIEMKEENTVQRKEIDELKKLIK